MADRPGAGDGSSPTYLLIDGNSLTYRAFHALPTDLATASGQVTNAVYGFTSMLLNLIRDHRPDGAVVCWDRPEPTFRHERIETYKAGRQAAPDILHQQFGLVRQVVETLGIPMLDLAGFEADDIIATLATRADDAGRRAIVVTGDRDAYQLVADPNVQVLYNRRGVSDYALYDEAGIEERTGVPPAKYVQYAAMRGDTSDNLPGVPGVGEKTAAKLLDRYGDLDGIFAHTDEQTPKLRENLEAHEDQVRENALVMQLVRDAPVEIDLDELAFGAIDEDELKRLFDFLEFHSLFDRLAEAFGPAVEAVATPADVIEAEIVTPEDPSDVGELIERLAQAKGPIAVAVAADGLALTIDPSMSEVLWLPADLLDADTVAALGPVLGPDGPGLSVHDAKAALHILWDLGFGDVSVAVDTRLAAYLIDPGETAYGLAELVRRYAQMELADEPDPDDAQGQLDLDGGDDSDDVRLDRHLARHALGVHHAAPALVQALDDHGLRSLNDQIEIPLAAVLARMERIGIGVDVDELTGLRDSLVAQVESLRQSVWDEAGREFNVNSTPQLREVLFEELGLTPQKKTKTGYSTDAQSLERMKGQHPIVEHLLEYREVEKLRSTYGDSLLAEVGADGRIHASFSQTVARTGRLSSEHPNLHNIPVRTDTGREFRRAFVPSAGRRFLVADYNQIELRCIAHLAADPGLIEAFESGTDVHTETAARIFSVAPDAVDVGMRSKAKMVSYGLAYGMEAYGLAQRLNIPVPEAAEILGAYFDAFPRVRAYMDEIVEETRERGYTETLFGRRRPIPELSSRNVRIRQAGERQAMNAPIQGLAADIFKVALVRLDAELDARDTRIVLQVHDEVICEVPPSEEDDVAEIVPRVMAGAAELAVPLEVNLSFGSSWAEAK